MKAKQRSKLRMASKAKNKRRFALPAIPAIPRSGEKPVTALSFPGAKNATLHCSLPVLPSQRHRH